MLTLPTLLIGILLSTLYGAIYHLVRDGGAGRLLLFLFLGWIGFWAGHFLAESFSLTFASLGQLRLGLATLGSFAFMLVGDWLSRIEVQIT